MTVEECRNKITCPDEEESLEPGEVDDILRAFRASVLEEAAGAVKGCERADGGDNLDYIVREIRALKDSP